MASVPHRPPSVASREPLTPAAAPCHNRSVLGLDANEQLLDRLGVEYRTLDAGCCGVADADTLILADGSSCRTQIETATSRSTVHLAELLHLAYRHARAR